MTIDFYGKAKSKRKRGQSKGTLARWFTNRVNFVFTAPLSIGECTERLDKERLTEWCNEADVLFGIFLPKISSIVSISLDMDDQLGLSIVEKINENDPRSRVRNRIEMHIRQMDAVSVFVEGKIICFVNGAERWMVFPLFCIFILLITLFPTNFISYVIWVAVILCLNLLGFIKNHHIRYSRLAIIRTMLEAKQKFDSEETLASSITHNSDSEYEFVEHTESSDGSSTQSTSKSASS
jgi:hypothetical protein